MRHKAKPNGIDLKQHNVRILVIPLSVTGVSLIAKVKCVSRSMTEVRLDSEMPPSVPTLLRGIVSNISS